MVISVLDSAGVDKTWGRLYGLGHGVGHAWATLWLTLCPTGGQILFNFYFFYLIFFF